MILVKFFGSLIILFIFIIVLFSVLGLLIFQKFFTDLFETLNGNGGKKNNGRKINSGKDIPTIAQCKKCGAYYTEIPDNGRCSCGNYL